MASLEHTRITGILIQNAIAELYAGVAPLHALSNVWTLNGIDDDLPDEGEIKTVYDAYKALKIPRLAADTALADVAASTETFDGVFAVPSTAFVVPFAFSGPVWAGLEHAQGFGVALTLQRLALFIANSGTTGSNLTVDLRLDGVSMLSAVVTVPVGSGQVNVIVPDSQIITRTIPAESILSAHIVTAPDDAESVTANVWLKQ